MKTKTNHHKSISMIGLIMLGLSFTNALHGQQNLPVLIRHLTFEEIASSKNTMNDDHLPMQFIASIECSFTEDEEETLPVDVYFNANNDLEKKSCCIMKWDASIRRWKKFTGGSIHQEKEAADRYFRCTIHESGTYALFQKLEHTGKTTITLPTNYAVSDWKFIQEKAGIVCEGHQVSQSIQIPYPEISPTADLQITIMDAESTPHELKGYKVGELLPQIWSKNGKEDSVLHLSKKQFNLLLSSNSISSSL